MKHVARNIARNVAPCVRAFSPKKVKHITLSVEINYAYPRAAQAQDVNKLFNTDAVTQRTIYRDCNYQLLDEAEYDMKNYADRGGCYPPKPKISFKIFPEL